MRRLGIRMDACVLQAVPADQSARGRGLAHGALRFEGLSGSRAMRGVLVKTVTGDLTESARNVACPTLLVGNRRYGNAALARRSL